MLDVNVLLALVSADHIHHRSALHWFTGIEYWATTPIVESAFLRLALNERVMGKQYDLGLVRSLMMQIRQQPGFQFLSDGSSLCEAIIELPLILGYQQVTDYHLVNLAAQHSVVFATFDAKLLRSLPKEHHRLIELVPVLV
ncbi:MAG: TA system VapC family ribonuclease toxin [Microbacteriaceae bacterium]